MRALFLAALLPVALLAQTPTWSDLMQSAKQMYLQGKYDEAVKQLQSATTRGSVSDYRRVQ